jgi:tetratricopeptide (TPR) repeat protein
MGEKVPRRNGSGKLEHEEDMDKQTGQLFDEGVSALTAGRTSAALECFEAAAELDQSPEILSNLALCLAKERRDFPRAIGLCRTAVSEEPWNSLHYLNLGRIHLLHGQRRDAIRVFRDGLLHEPNPLIRDELKGLGTRKYPVIASLPREHRVNIFLGRLFKKLRLR